MVQALFPDGDGIFQVDNAQINATHVVKNWYVKHEIGLKHMEWPSQYPNLNIIEHLWCVFERKLETVTLRRRV